MADFNGTAGPDVWVGSGDNETAHGGGGNDDLQGGGGNDTIYGEADDDTLNGDDGNDTIWGGAGLDHLFGGAGDDIFWAHHADLVAGEDYHGGSGSDAVLISTGASAIDLTGLVLDGIETLQAGALLVSGDPNLTVTMTPDQLNGLQDLSIGFGTLVISAGGTVDFTNGRMQLLIINLNAAGNTLNLSGVTILNYSPAQGPYINGSAVSDNVFGSDNNDVIYGNDGNDVLDGGRFGSDLLDGGAGDDRLMFTSTSGSDAFYGGSGIDTFDASNATAGVTVNLGLNPGDTGSGPGGSQLHDIENLDGSAFGDTLIGNSGANRLQGLGGNDSLQGGAGNDLLDGGDGDDELFGGAGDDQYIGGAGMDTLRFDFSTPGVVVDLQAQTVTGEGTDTITGVENVEATRFDDVLTGDDEANRLYGAGGSDTINGGGGNDELNGDLYDSQIPWAGSVDTIHGGGGDDDVTLGLNDNATGGADVDSLTIILFNVSQGTTIDLSAMWGGGVGTNGTGTVSGFERIRYILGSNGADSITVGTGAMLTTPDFGPPHVRGYGGDDQLTGGDDRDSLLGDDGNDVVLGLGGDDQLSGGAGDDRIEGGAGDDFINGDGGFDILIGGAGSDLYVYGDGAFPDGDQIVEEAGDAGVDRLLIRPEWQGSAGDSIFTGVRNVEEVELITLEDIAGPEFVLGAQFQAAGFDTLIARADVDASAVTADMNILVSRPNIRALTITAGSGDDVFRFDEYSMPPFVHDYTLNGGAGYDVIHFANSLQATFHSGGASLILTGFEAFVLAGGVAAVAVAGGPDKAGRRESYSIALDDEIVAAGLAFQVDATDLRANFIGNLGADGEIGGTGANADLIVSDQLFLDASALSADRSVAATGGGGADNLTGGADGDSLTGGGGNDILHGGGGADSIVGGDGDDTLNGGDGDDTVDGGAGNDTINGNAGNDVIDGGTGADAMTGGDGDDTFYVDAWFPFPGQPVDTVIEASNGGNDRVLARSSFGLAGGSHVETLATADPLATTAINLTGNEFAQTITGNAGANVLQGKNGDDILNGGDGDDTLYGGDSSAVSYNDDDDVLNGGAGNDTLYGGGGNDTVNGGDGNDYLSEGGGGNNILNGDDGDDVIGVSGSLSMTETNIVSGGAGDDQITLFFSHGSVSGGSGNDIIRANRGTLTIDGGDGDDQLSFGEAILFTDGVQTATGGAGADRFTVADTSRYNERDRILDFNAAEGDRLELADVLNGRTDVYWAISGASLVWAGALDPANFVLGATLAPDDGAGANLVRIFTTQSGGNTYLIADSDCDRIFDAQDMVLEFAGTVALDAASFVDWMFVARLGTAGADTMTGTADWDLLYGMAGNDILTGGSGGFDALFGGDGDDQLDARFSQSAYLDGGAGNDILRSGDTNNFGTLTGGAGDDVIEGSGQLLGGDGNDILRGLGYLDGGNGNDIIEGGPGQASLVGWAGDDILRSGIGENSVQGGTGVDVIDYSLLQGAVTVSLANHGFQNTGAGGTDLIGIDIENLTGTNFGDTLGGDDNANLIQGLGGGDTINGLGGHDTLDGGAGADTLAGGAGNDYYVVDNVGDLVIEAANEGYDVVLTSVSYALGAGTRVEALAASVAASAAALDLTGNEFTNALYGNAGANVLDGRGGNDFLLGLGGNDYYVVDSAGDTIIEAAGEGYDVVLTSVSYALAAGTHVEALSTADWASTAALDLTGNELANALYGNAGANVLNGGSGNDYLIGMAGNDYYVVDSAGDVVIEAASEGYDVVLTSVGYALGAGTHVEALSTADWASTAALDLTGNELGNALYGNAGANVLNGGGGNDYLIGMAGSDYYVVDSAGDAVIEAANEGYDVVLTSVGYALGAGTHVEALSTADWASTASLDLTGNELGNALYGNAGANILNGGGGADYLIGLGGADIFAFATALGAGNVDTITDFVSGTDRIALDDAVFSALSPGALSANAFVIGTAAADADDRILYDQATGRLYYDADGNGSGAAVLFATLDGAPLLTAGDFSVI